jgi:4-amino-4-deoxy-L-arabinose transferase-like glycosyltransferase
LWWFFGIVEVLTFFYFANSLTRKWSRYSEKKFNKKLFQNAIIIRISWVLISYVFYNYMTGQPFEFGAADAAGYHSEGMWFADLIHSGNIQPYFDYLKGRFSDMGYTFYLGFQYALTDKSIIIERLLKALYGAFTCVLIYKLAKRNFGEDIARMAAVFCMLMPNLILYCGIHTKEVEMVLLTVAFMERADFLLRSKNLNFLTLAPTLLLASSLFFFRTVLGATALFALFTALVFSTTHVLNMGKRVILVVWVLVTVAYFAGSGVASEIEATWQARGANQETSMNMRATEVNGNKFVKKLGGAMFAPIILVIPFPTIIETPDQENQKLINGGNYVKNVMAFFVIFTIFTVIRQGKWREYLLLGSFTIGYSLVLAMSAFAHSERFHQPTLPFELILAAVGISLMTNKTKKYYNWWMIFLFVAIVGWSWFKLAGRGMT